MERNKKLLKKLLMWGVSLILTGVLLLLATTKIVTSKELKIIWPLFIITLGLYFQWMAFCRNKKEIYILIGMFLTLSGIYIFLANAVLKIYEIKKIWPFFMLFSGVSLIPYGLKKKNKEQRIPIFVPAFSIIVLSLFFLLFSFKISKIKFLTFASVWWPAVFIVMGLTIIIIFLIKNYEHKKSRDF